MIKKRTDSELLRLAFKAWAPGENYTRMVNDAGYDYWNPLKDDGQALRLAVKLGITELWFDKSTGAPEVVAGFPGTGPIFEPFGSDPCAATRRAIVRAAAEIGANL